MGRLFYSHLKIKHTHDWVKFNVVNFGKDTNNFRYTQIYLQIVKFIYQIFKSMSKTIFKAAEACVAAIEQQGVNTAIVSTSRVYPTTKAWYVQAHSEYRDGSYIVAYMWYHDSEPTTMNIPDAADFSRYMTYMYDLPE